MIFFHCKNSKKIKRGNICLFLAFGLFLPANLLAQIKISGNVLSWEKSGFFLNRLYHNTNDDNPFETQTDFNSRFRINNKFMLKDLNILLGLNFEARYEALSNNENTKKDMDLLLKEAYLEFRRPKYGLTIGRQIITWGKLDDIIILDRISPQDYNRFILYDKQERKLPLFMIKYDYSTENSRFEALVLPLFKPSNVSFAGSDWSVYDHLLKSVEEGNFSPAAKNVIRRINFEEKDNLTDKSLKNSQFGLRMRGKTAGIDYGLYYMNLYDTTAVLREKTPAGNRLKKFLNFPTDENLSNLVNSNPSDIDLTLEKEHSRTNILGIDAETILGEYGIRGEAALVLGTAYSRDDFSYIRKNNITLAAGIDRTTAGNLYLNLQFIETVILNYEPLFPNERYSHQITASLSKDFLREKLLFNLKSTLNISYGDWMLNPRLTYKFNNGFETALAGFIFEGSPTTLFGRFSTNDLVYLELKYRF